MSDYKETKEYLSQIERLYRMIENKCVELSQLRQIVINASPKTSGDVIQASRSPDGIGNAIIKIVDMEREINKIVDGYMAKRRVIISQIDDMEDVRFYNVLSKRYVAGMRFEEIASEVPCDLRHLFRIHNKALGAFEKKYGSTYIKNKP